MALNGASHNATGEPTAPVTAAPPAVADDIKQDILASAQADATGQSAPGVDGGDKDAGKKVKSEKELEKERKKADKDAKFKAKKAQAAAKPAAPAKEKKVVKKAADDVLPEYVEETKKGDKKILRSLDDPFMKAYIPKVVESAWYDWWEKEGFFKPELVDGEVKEAGHFVIPVPPPNVTGKLHCGHALGTALQDVLIRWNRMKGLTTLYLPGCDHAGISTQSVVENMLWRSQKKTRHDLGREKFVETTMAWKDEYHTSINGVLKRLGGSFDWTREAFTMDENLSAAVTETFVRLHEEGLIYRSNRLVNWCTKLQSSVSNLEVDNKELAGRTLLDVPGYERKVEFGVITHFKYPIDGTDEFIEVATTRPETMLGDTAVAVHPTDERYKHLVGKFAKHPFVDRLIPIIADTYVDPEFGTGAVKITPAHDTNDFAMGKRHNLEFINILNDDGTLNHNTGPFAGQKRFDVRYTVTEQLTQLGLFVKKEDNPMKVPLCSRTKDVIEPIQKPQWWMSMKSLAGPAIDAVESGEIQIFPESSKKVYNHWMNNITDWCLSRALWWGHQIPAYYVKVDGESPLDEADNEAWVCGRTEEEAKAKAAAKFPGKKITLRRDEDVLDTWFSSGLWPFSTLGWPNEQSLDLKTLFPTSVLETGWDILFFWVARMIMLSIKLTGKIPFKEVYCHSLIRDSEGRKMSKSLGNVIDPIDIMQGITLDDLNNKLLMGNLDPKELKTATKYQQTSFPKGIPECGADALRMALVSYTTGGGDINFAVDTIHGYRKFCNKIYQATKFVMGRLGDDFVPRATVAKGGNESLSERWILHKLNNSAKVLNERLAAREFSLATQVAHRYFLENLCDVFIENSKALFESDNAQEIESAKQTLYTAIEGGLLMIHPFMPFITEELWQRLPRRSGDATPSITIASFPQHTPALEDRAANDEYELLVEVSKGIRSLTSEYNIKDNAVTFIQPLDAATQSTLQNPTSRPSIIALAGKAVSTTTVLSRTDYAPTGCAVYTVGAVATVFLDLKGRVDVKKEIQKARERLGRALEAQERLRKGMEGEWESKVSGAVRETEMERLRKAEAEARNWEASLGQFERLGLGE